MDMQVCVCIHIYIYIYIYREREGERERNQKICIWIHINLSLSFYIYVYIFFLIKQKFFKAVAVSVLFYSCTTRMNRTVNGNYTRILHPILNKFWKQNPRKPQLYGHLLPILQTIQMRWARHAGDVRRNSYTQNTPVLADQTLKSV